MDVRPREKQGFAGAGCCKSRGFCNENPVNTGSLSQNLAGAKRETVRRAGVSGGSVAEFRKAGANVLRNKRGVRGRLGKLPQGRVWLRGWRAVIISGRDAPGSDGWAADEPPPDEPPPSGEG